MSELTAAQEAVVRLLLEGRSDKEIAAALGISVASVKSKLAEVRAKLGARCRIDVVMKLWKRYGRAA